MDLEEVIRKVKDCGRITMVVGSSDTGKTALITSLANGLWSIGRTSGVVDADIGQSTVGPPTKIGLGVIHSPVQYLSQAELKGIYFVGSTSPKGHLLPQVVGTKKMVDKALKMGFDHILVDTTGLVEGPLGQELKGHKIELIDPSLIIFLQHQSECGSLLQRFQSCSGAHVLVLPPSPKVRNKSPAERKEYREKAFLSYFAGSTIRKLQLKNLYLVDFPFLTGLPASESERILLSEIVGEEVVWAETFQDEVHIVTSNPMINGYEKVISREIHATTVHTHTVDEFENILVGCHDGRGECYSLAIVRKADFGSLEFEVEIAHEDEEPRGLKFSRYRIDQNGSGCIVCGNMSGKSLRH
jgi:polynucleotide 5'-hydroxyl-kinase GRC3/NOL9